MNLLFVSYIVIVGFFAGVLVNVLADVLPQLNRQNVSGRKTAQLHNTVRELKASVSSRTLRWCIVIVSSICLTALSLFGRGLIGGSLIFAQEIFVLQIVYLFIFLLIVVIDIEHRRVLNIVIIPATVFSLIFAVSTSSATLMNGILGGVSGFSIFFLLALLRPGAMGMGDVKLAGLIGVIVGFPSIISAIIVGVLTGGLGAVLLILFRRTQLDGTMAYAPYLVAGAVLSLFNGTTVLQWMLM